jgi:hypothetical protein
MEYLFSRDMQKRLYPDKEGNESQKPKAQYVWIVIMKNRKSPTETYGIYHNKSHALSHAQCIREELTCSDQKFILKKETENRIVWNCLVMSYDDDKEGKWGDSRDKCIVYRARVRTEFCTHPLLGREKCDNCR